MNARVHYKLVFCQHELPTDDVHIFPAFYPISIALYEKSGGSVPPTTHKYCLFVFTQKGHKLNVN